MDEFERFFSEHYGEVLRAVALAVGDPQAAEEQVQEAFATAYRKWSSVSVMERPVAWIYTVAMNGQRRQWRRDARPKVGEPTAVVGPEEDVLNRVVLATALSRLSSRQRAAVVLRVLAGLSVAETAAVMACAEGTVKATLHQALAALRIELAEEDSA